jgi:hypothetical protein
LGGCFGHNVPKTQYPALVVTLSTGSTIVLATTSTLTGSLTVTAGDHGDALISFAARLGYLNDPPLGYIVSYAPVRFTMPGVSLCCWPSHIIGLAGSTSVSTCMGAIAG